MEDALFWVMIIGLAFIFLFLPQWQMRRRQQKKMAELAVGDRIVTIGGFIGTLKDGNPVMLTMLSPGVVFIGTLTALDFEQDRARLKLADGVEVEIVTGAIGRKLE